MRYSLVLLALLLFATFALGAQKKHEKKEKPKGPYTIILPVVGQATATGEEATFQSVYARAGILEVFSNHKFQPLGPAEMQGTADQLHLDLKDPAVWTSDNFDKLAQPWTSPYIAGLQLISVESKEDVAASSGPKKPSTSTVTAHVKVAAWLYDLKTHKFAFQNQPSEFTYSARKGPDRGDLKAIRYEAVILGAKNAFKDYLDRAKPGPRG